LVLARGQWHFGKVAVGLALQRPCVADLVVYPPTGSTISKGDEHPAYKLEGHSALQPLAFSSSVACDVIWMIMRLFKLCSVSV